jgi:serine protease SohB
LELLQQYGLFLAQTVTLLLAFGVIVGVLVTAGNARRQNGQGAITVRKLNDDMEEMTDSIQSIALDKFQLKKWHKEQDQKDKQETKEAKQRIKGDAAPAAEPVHYVMDFDGDLSASAVDNMRYEITAILSVATAKDEVIVRLESAGGMVHAYGLAASQLARIRDAGIKLTICVDRMAASGGYMMACLANHIVAAPFALVGSIGVVAEVPNIHRLLKKHAIDVEVLTAGEHKRSLTVIGENTRKGKDKFIEDLQITHQLFKDWVVQQRPVVVIDDVADGDVWYGQQALNKQLVDQLGTSDDYLCACIHDKHAVLLVSYERKKSIGERLGIAAARGIEVLSAKLRQQMRTYGLSQ